MKNKKEILPIYKHLCNYNYSSSPLKKLYSDIFSYYPCIRIILEE